MLNYFMTMASIKLNNNEGQGMVEYALIIGLVAVALVGGIGLLTGGITDTFTAITNAL